MAADPLYARSGKRAWDLGTASGYRSGMSRRHAVDPEIEAFTYATIDSFVTWDVIVFFHDWPGFAGDAEATARCLGRGVVEAQVSLERLVNLGVLRRATTDGVAIYSYGPNTETAARVEAFSEAMEGRESRLALLAGLLRKGIR